MEKMTLMPESLLVLDVVSCPASESVNHLTPESKVDYLLNLSLPATGLW
jgi:hypothetical protein